MLKFVSIQTTKDFLINYSGWKFLLSQSYKKKTNKIFYIVVCMFLCMFVIDWKLGYFYMDVYLQNLWISRVKS